MGNTKLVDITGLSRYHENLKNVFNTKQDVIEDLEAIRSGAAKGATALQEVPAEYVTETELAGMNYATVDQVNAKQDTISDLDDIRSGAAAGATALQAVPAEYITETELAGMNYATVDQVNAKQDAISDLETIRSGAADGADALSKAKEYADSLVKDAEGNALFDEAGAAAQALDAAKADAASLYQVKGNYETAGTAAGLNDAMDERVKVLEAIDHNKIATDAAAAAVAGVIDEAPESFDTLKEVAAWIANNDHATDVATLMTDVENLKKIDHNAYAEADKTVLADANAYADSLVMVDGVSKFDAAGAAATAEQNAKDYVDGKGYATTAQVNAKQDAISDLETIRSGAAAGATALQAVPDEYVTETELTGKGYLTANDLSFAADSDIDDLFA